MIQSLHCQVEPARGFPHFVGLHASNCQDERILAAARARQLVGQLAGVDRVGGSSVAVALVNEALQKSERLGVTCRVARSVLLVAFDPMADAECTMPRPLRGGGRAVRTDHHGLAGGSKRVAPAGRAGRLLNPADDFPHADADEHHATHDQQTQGHRHDRDEPVATLLGRDRNRRWCDEARQWCVLAQTIVQRLPLRHAGPPNDIVFQELSGLPASAQFLQREFSENGPLATESEFHGA